ncbi:MAG: NADH-quinone oxidoreductase subunit J [Deltaproteobacteria bacterium]|nr:NADH-quinone oxidoreductase subunit J [Deltaproteobacteria bacterium]
MEIQQILFFSFAALILLSAALVALRPRPIESAMWLILNFFLTAGLYILLGSNFVSIIQVLVYAGAIMVLFVFVILLLNLDPREFGSEAGLPWTSLVMFIGFLTFIVLSLHVATPELMKKLPEIKETGAGVFGSIESISMVLLKNYVWGFEIAGVILLLALIGVGLLAYRKPPVRARAIHTSTTDTMKDGGAS